MTQRSGWRPKPGSVLRLLGWLVTSTPRSIRMTTTAPHIPGVGTVYLAVHDQGRALAFYRDVLGFEVRTDAEFGEGFRWVEVAPPGAYTMIALVRPAGDDDPQPGGNAPFGFDTPDLDAAMAE